MEIANLAAQYGFPAVALAALWLAYRELAPKLLGVIERNSVALESLTKTLESNTSSIDRLASVVQDMDKRLLRVEERHEVGSRS